MILVVQNQLPHYRRAFFNALCDIDEVIVLHSGKPVGTDGERFKELTVPQRRFGPFNLQIGLNDVIMRLAPTTVIASADLRNLMSFVAMFRFERRLKWVWWGLDKGGSALALAVKTWLVRRDNPVVFYNHAIRDEFQARGLAPDRLFVANNTFHVDNHQSFADTAPKDCFINVGTLDPRKRNDVAVRAFRTVLDKSGRDFKLYLIGEGRDRDMLEVLIAELDLAGSVILTGKIEDPKQLEGYYARAIASVSFGQAGLAVIQSMAFGVPFITKTDAISGGEKHNIISRYNGIFCDDDQRSLEAEMLRLVEDSDYARELGRNAYAHYVDNASIQGMVGGFHAALSCMAG